MFKTYHHLEHASSKSFDNKHHQNQGTGCEAAAANNSWRAPSEAKDIWPPKKAGEPKGIIERPKWTKNMGNQRGKNTSSASLMDNPWCKYGHIFGVWPSILGCRWKVKVNRDLLPQNVRMLVVTVASWGPHPWCIWIRNESLHVLALSWSVFNNKCI